jgi:hypothetical protein
MIWHIVQVAKTKKLKMIVYVINGNLKQIYLQVRLNLL